MLRELKLLSRNSGKTTGEIENIPTNPTGAPATEIAADTSRPPLTTIQEPPPPPQNPRTTKTAQTPTKTRTRYSDAGMPLRTPEKRGVLAGNRFGWAQSSSNGNESRDESRAGNGIASTATPRVNKANGRANSGYSECNSAQTTPTKSVSKPPNPALCLTGGGSRHNHANGGAARAAANFAALSRGIPISCSLPAVVNTIEVPHFDLKEDPSFWMDHNVQVLIRVRPLNSMEKSTQGYNRCLKQESAQCITWIGQPETRFTFDHVACETIDQETLFRMVGLPMVENCLSGYNSCMFAYGQTGSGKTYTMLGEIDEIELKPSLNRGMTPRIFEFLFARIRAEEEIRIDERLTYNCKCSFLEIYNEQITDLLDPASTNLLLREDSMKGVYVENLTEFDVQTVGDILKLLSQGSSNRKVAATNMNRESSRSHSVFTCVIESRWEKDSTSNLRFARLNLVDLAGSERQKTSGAEGERLKEAANINKSLSTLGHVIMVLLDVANGKPRHVPYRDSRLTFLLQDSLGGNSKTVIIANISPSICCATESLNTLKFAQRAKLIQNNAVVNEDSSGDVIALQQQIRLLKEELSALKRQHVSRSLSFGPSPTVIGDTREENDNGYIENIFEMDPPKTADMHGRESKGTLRVSSKQLKCVEITLAGSLRREKIAETSIKQLEAEIEQLDRLVRQREEDTRCTKMMLKFREEKIQRMESLLDGLIPADSYLLEENSALSEEIQLLQAKVDRNPEVTRFALENIRLLEQLRRYQDFYEEGEREMLMTEVSGLRDQLALFLDGNQKQHHHQNMNMQPEEAICMSKENNSLHLELKKTQMELEECKSNLDFCLERNTKLCREIDDLRASLCNTNADSQAHNGSVEVIKESILETPSLDNQSFEAVQEEKEEETVEALVKQTEEVLNLQLEADILKIILKEERSSRNEMEEKALFFTRDQHLAKEKISLISKQCEQMKDEIREAKSVIEALEAQQLISISEVEDLRNSNDQYAVLLRKHELEIFSLKEKLMSQELRDPPSVKHSESGDSPLQSRLKKMQYSLEKAKTLNTRYQSDRVSHASNEEEMDVVRRQVEAETAEVIVCLQEELGVLQQQIHESNLKETETEVRLAQLQTELKELQEKSYQITHDNVQLGEKLKEKDNELRTLSEEWEQLTGDIEVVLAGGHEALKDASDQLDAISSSFPQKRILISEQLGRITRSISEKQLMIEELNRVLEDANNRRNDMDCMLRSLRGATLVITEAHQHDISEKDKEIVLLQSQLREKTSIISELEEKVNDREEQFRKASTCATVAFLIVNRLSEVKRDCLDALKHKNLELSDSKIMNIQKDAVLHNQAGVINEAEDQIKSLRMELNVSEENCWKLREQLTEEKKYASGLERKIEDVEENYIIKMREKLTEFSTGVSTLKSCMKEYAEQVESPEQDIFPLDDDKFVARTGTKGSQDLNIDVCSIEGMEAEFSECRFKVCKKNMRECSSDQKTLTLGKTLKDASDRNATIVLLKKEIESALESLKEVQVEMAKLRDEKEEVLISEKGNRERIDSLMLQVVGLKATMCNFEEQCSLKLVSLDHKLRTAEETMQESVNYWFGEKELFELELGDAKTVAAQKTAEGLCILAKFEEAQDTMKEADIMINELMIANKVMKFEIDGLKTKEVNLINERDTLINEVWRLKTSSIQKDCQYEDLVQQFESDFVAMKGLIQEMEGVFLQVQATFQEDSISVASGLLCLKSQFHESTLLTRSWLEDVWSEIIVKDCAVSVLHLCHIGILLETVTGLNAENGLLQHGICESNSVISELREHNFKSRRELEVCRTLKGKLLADIKNSFDRISRKEDETSMLTTKLTSFEKKIVDLQLQEEIMLQRSDYMGSELALLIKELDLSHRNVVASILDQEKLLTDREELISSLEEKYMMDLCTKDFELLILVSELKLMAVQKANVEKEQISYSAVLETLKKDIVLVNINAELKDWILQDKDIEVAVLQKEAEVVQREQQALLSVLEQRDLEIFQTKKANRAFEQDIELLKEAASSSFSLKAELDAVMEAKLGLSSQVKKLEEDLKMKEAGLEISSSRISVMDEQNAMLQENLCALETSLCKLQTELEVKDTELTKTRSLEEENESLESELRKLKADYHMLFQDTEEKKSDVESSIKGMEEAGKEIHRLQSDLGTANEELNELRLHESVLVNELRSKTHDFQIQVDKINTVSKENILLRDELRSHENVKYGALKASSSNMLQCIDSVENIDAVSSRVAEVLNKKYVVLEKMFQEMCKNVESTSKFISEITSLENFAKELTAVNLSLQTELERKDEVLEGLLFDLRLLQESASSTKDQKDENEELVASLEALDYELAVQSNELDEAVDKGQKLEAQLQEKMNLICTLELDVAKERESVILLSRKNLELIDNIEYVLKAKVSIEEELTEKRKDNESLETELMEMGSTLEQMNKLIESLKRNLSSVTSERDDLNADILALKKDFEMARALAEENEAIATEARQVAETRKVYAEDKEEEVRLLERSVEELECTVNVLENKADIVKGEAERQRLQREELELELHTVKQQLHNVEINDADMKRHLDEKQKNLQEALQRIWVLEREMASKNSEIDQCKAHITELNLHAEAQACEYKQKFKALEAMAELVKPEGSATHIKSEKDEEFTAGSKHGSKSTNKLEKNGSKPRGSGSPFKCIGLGLAQQIKSEKDEELTAGRCRIDELEALAASRQKEIFSLNARLAAAESMTHDVIRDLLGLKLDMNNYASLLDNQQLQRVAEKAQLYYAEAQVKEQEAVKLKQQLNGFIEERRGWLAEIDRKQAELVAAQVALEKLHQRDRLLATENEMFKMENVNYKKKVMELEAEVKNLSGQQNLHQRIHHHAKIKEENNLLIIQKEDLSSKLRRTEGVLSRVKEELAHFRAANGRSPYINFDNEQRLTDKLKETEEERLQLAQKLVALCTSILKTAGVTRPPSDINLFEAEEALEQLKNRVSSLERELHDVRYKNKITNERIRLSELKPQSSPLNSRTDENHHTPSPSRASQTPFFSALDR